MTRPSHPFEVRHRDVFSIAVPATFAFITEPLAGLTDLTVIGRLGDASMLAGVVLGGLGTSMIFAFMFFLRLGTAGLTAQSVGARDPDDGLVHLIRAILISVVLGVAVIGAVGPLRNLVALLLAPPAGAEAHYATYFDIRLLSTPFVCLNNAIIGWLYGRAAAVRGMLVQMLLFGSNIVLSIWFVYGMGWDVAGVAWATVLAQVIATIAGAILILMHYRTPARMAELVSFERLRDPVAFRRLFTLSRDLTIRSAVLMGAFAWFTAQTSRAGEVPLAANELLLHFMMMTAFFLDGQGQAAEQLCGKAVGANYRPAFERAVWVAIFWGLIIGFVLFIFWLVAGPALIDFMSTNEEIRAEARLHLFLAALTAFTGVVPFVLDGVTQGATLNNVIRNGMLAATAIYLAASILLQSLFGIAGLWMAIHVFFLARAVIFWVGVERAKPKLFAAA